MAERPKQRQDYTPEALEVVRAGLLHVAVKLGDYMDDIVVVGGLVPSLLIDQRIARRRHLGTTDLDLGLALTVLDAQRYQAISTRLRAAGFHPSLTARGAEQRQSWELRGKLGRVAIDFLIPESKRRRSAGLIQNLERDFAALRTRALELAFVDRRTITLEGTTIEGDYATRTVHIAGPCAALTLKAFAFKGRGEAKDAYDLWYLLSEIGIDAVADDLVRYRADKRFADDISDALAIVARDFTAFDSVGIGHLVRFVGETADENLRADAAGYFAAIVRRLRR